MSCCCKLQQQTTEHLHQVDFLPQYASFLRDLIKKGVSSKELYHFPLAGLRIVVDAGNGSGGFFADQVSGGGKGSGGGDRRILKPTCQNHNTTLSHSNHDMNDHFCGIIGWLSHLRFHRLCIQLCCTLDPHILSCSCSRSWPPWAQTPPGAASWTLTEASPIMCPTRSTRQPWLRDRPLSASHPLTWASSLIQTWTGRRDRVQGIGEGRQWYQGWA